MLSAGLSLLGTACGGDSLSGEDIGQLRATQNPGNPLSFFVTYRTAQPTATDLHVSCGTEYDETFTDTEPKTSHEIFVMGLIDGTRCEAMATAGDAGAMTEFEVGPLPEGLPQLDVRVSEPERMAPGWTLSAIRESERGSTLYLFIIDPQGRYRWLYTFPGGTDPEVQVVDQGLLFGIPRNPQIVDWEGNVRWGPSGLATHHDLRISPFDEDNVLYLGVGACEEHTVVEMNRATQEIVWEWEVCNHWTPRVDYFNWSHLNTVEPVPGEEAVLVSSRDQDLVFKVDRNTSDVVWTLGRDGDFDMDPNAWFYRQHAPEVLEDGHILILDNGVREEEAVRTGLMASEAREHTRVVEYELSFDESGEPARAEIAWEYTDEDVFAADRSEADRLSNGNTLIHYVSVQPNQQLIMREVTHEGDVVWDLISPHDLFSYRSERIAPSYGYVVSEE
jgi:hypothetical protein